MLADGQEMMLRVVARYPAIISGPAKGKLRWRKSCSPQISVRTELQSVKPISAARAIDPERRQKLVDDSSAPAEPLARARSPSFGPRR